MKKKEDRLKVFEVDHKWVYSKNMYHRGKFDNVKVHENTIEAYKAAMEEKCPIELDVRLTGDGEVVCLHDRSLKRLFNRESKYPHEYENHYVEQDYLPKDLLGKKYYVFGNNKTEQAAKAYFDFIKANAKK